LELPGWVAWIVQVPGVTNVTVVTNDTVHTGKEVEVKPTARPEDAVALTANEIPNTWFARAPKAMVWLAGVTVKLWGTAVAAA
jgi:hypothetical protein